MFKPTDYVDKNAIVEKLYSLDDRYSKRTLLSRKLIKGKQGQILTMALAALAPSEKEKIIEFGAGNGYFANLMVETGCNHVLATDLSPYQVEHAQTRYPHIQFQVVDVENPPFPDGSFDAAVLNFMLYHLEDPKKALEKVKRLLIPCGRILVTTKGSNSYEAIEKWHQETLKQLGLTVSYPRDELRVSEKNIENIVPDGMSVEVSIQCRATLQLNYEDLIIYLDSTPWTYYDLLDVERKDYYQIMTKLAKKERFNIERVEWAFLIAGL